ncbi:MAG: M20/M25/M40 family metallo-hydrolase [Bacteroidota bacterium]
MKKNIFLFVLLFAATGAFSQNADDSVNVCKRLRYDVTVLSHDSMEGRETGSPGELRAAHFIVKRFKEIGLKPITPDYLQSLDFVDGVKVGDSNFLFINEKSGTLNKDFWPLSYAGNTSIKGESVYVKFGVTAPNMGYDDYSGMNNLQGKIFVIDMYGPDGERENSKYKDFIDPNTKIELAIKKGAAGIIFINTAPKQYDPQKFLNSRTNPYSIPVIFATGDFVKVLTDKNPAKINISTQLKRVHKTGYNVLGIIDNNAPFTVVLGGHYDHLGYGEDGSMYTGKKAVHNGADDNASGIAGLLELAKHYVNSDKKSFNYLFVAFTGEEKGFLGSNYFIKSGIFDLKKINYMLNFDMIGRLSQSEKTIALYGTGTSPSWKKAIESIPARGLKLSSQESGMGSSDHVSFYLREIPAIHLFTNSHADYHKPTDDVELLNFGGMYNVVTFSEKLIDNLDGEGKLTFTKTTDAGPQRVSLKVTLGVVPDLIFTGKGFRIEGVSAGKIAEKVGMKGGDIIVKLGDYNINDINAYMSALTKFSKGDKTKVVVLRDAKEMTFDVEF